MPKFKINVSRTYSVTHIVNADSLHHAHEIGSEITDEMDVNINTYTGSDWSAVQVDDGETITYKQKE